MSDKDNKYDFSGMDKLAEIPDHHFDYVAKSKTPEEPPSLSDAGDFARGVVSGPLLGHASELAGAGEATLDKVKGALTGQETKDWADLYRQHQQESQTNFKQAQERSPWLYGAGQLAGVVGAGALTAGAGYGLGGAGLGAAAAEGGAAGVAGELGLMGAEGALIGGAQAAGDSEGNLSSVEGQKKLASDAWDGVKGGAILGPVAGVAGAGLGWAGGKASQYIENSPMLRRLLQNAKDGMSGISLSTGQEELGSLAGKLKDHSEGFTRKLLGAEQSVGQEIGATLENAGYQGKRISAFAPDGSAVTFLDDANQLKEFLQNNPSMRLGDKGGILADLNNFTTSGKAFTPEQASSFRDKLIQFGKSPAAASVDGMPDVINNLQRGIREELTNAVPELDGLYQKFYGLRQAGSEAIQSGGVAPDIAKTWAGSLKNHANTLNNGVEDMLSSVTTPGHGQIKGQQTLEALHNGLNEFGEQFPGFLEQHGIDAPKLKQDLLRKADDFATAHALTGSSLGHGASVANLVKTAGGGMASYPTRIANTAGAVANPVVGMGHALYDAPEAALKSVAQKLNEAGLNTYGEALLKNLNENSGMKNSILFSIMQNPHARMILNGDQSGTDTAPNGNSNYNFDGLTKE